MRIWSTEPVRMQKARPEMVLVFCLQISHRFFSQGLLEPLGIRLDGERDYGVGMFFFPQDELKRNQAKKMFESHRTEKEGLEFLGWRKVPIRSGCAWTRKHWKCMPCIEAGIYQTSDIRCGKGSGF